MYRIMYDTSIFLYRLPMREAHSPLMNASNIVHTNIHLLEKKKYTRPVYE